MPRVALVLASFTLLTQIGAAPEPVTVRFDAPAGCPGEREFFDELRARTPHVRRAHEGEPSRILRVWVERDAERSVGRLVIEDQGTASAPRVVSAPTCVEAVKALALVAAISIDPSAAAPAQAEDAGAPLEAEASASEASAEPAPKEPDAPPALYERPAEPRAIERPRGPSALRFGGGFALDAMGVAAPGARLAPRVFAELVVDRPALFAPSLRLSGTRFTSTELSIPGASASFIWSIVRLDGCPIALRPAPQIVVRPCAAFDAGTLHAEGIGGVATQSRLRPWAAVGALARAEWSVIGPLVVSAELAAAVPLVREDFFFAPDAQPGGTIYAAPAIAVEGGAGLAVRFP